MEQGPEAVRVVGEVCEDRRAPHVKDVGSSGVRGWGRLKRAQAIGVYWTHDHDRDSALARMRNALRETLETQTSDDFEDSEVALDDESLRRLAALGYVGGGDAEVGNTV